MKRPLIAALLCLGLTTAAHSASQLLYIGTRGSEPKQGIYAANFDNQTGKLSLIGQQAELNNAAWLVINPSLPVLYSVANAEGGLAVESNVHSFKIDKASGKLTPINTVGAGGRDATYLYLDAKSNTLFAANHASGDVTALPLQADGSLGKVVSDQKTAGTGPHRRQSFPQPHSVIVDPANRRYVLAADFGADRIYMYRFDPKTRALTPAKTPFQALPPGTGPRHLAFTSNGKFLYMISELSAEIYVFSWDAKNEKLEQVQSFSSYPADYTGSGDRSAAEIGLSRDGKYVYACVRGDQNSLVVYSVDRKNGKLTEIQRLPSAGKTPRSFEFDASGRWLLVAHEGGSTVNVFRVDPGSGKLTATNESLSIPNAAVFAFYSGR